VTRTPTRAAPSGPPPIPVAPVIPTLTPTIAPTLPPLPPVIAEGFDDPDTGFPRLGDTQPGAGYQNGEYVLLVNDPDGFAIAELTGGRCAAIVPGCSFGDLTVEVDIRAVGPTNGGSYGLVFHRQFVGGYLQYFVLIDPEKGEVRLVRWSDTERLEVIKPTALPSIARGEGKNRLTITAKGQAITVGVNGTNLPTVTDAGPATGLVALRADAGAGPIAVHFDGFIIRPAR
jgi:hypothetical protein